MILAKLRGGLSNQMFQYAAARRLAHRHGTGVKIDTSWYDAIPAGATPRRYELDQLCISGERASHWEVIGTDGLRNTPLHELPVALFRKVRPRYRFVPEIRFGFDPQILDLPDNVCLFGYWVSERYFFDIEETIRDEFRFRAAPSPSNAARMNQLRSCESVAVHVRRGDYASNPALTKIHGLCGPDYYSRAADAITARTPDPVFFLFSDDLDWAKEKLKLPGETVVVDDNRGDASAQDLRLMSAARHNIIANSGFSWWAAWLNPNPQKIVVAPRRWLADPSYDTSNVFPPAWTLK